MYVFLKQKLLTNIEIESTDGDPSGEDRGDGSTDDNHYYDKVGADASAVGEVQGVVVACSEDDNSKDVDNVKGKEVDVKGDDFFNGLSQLEIDDDQVIFVGLEAVAKINTRRAIRKPVVRELSVELGARSEKEARIGQENVVEEVRTSQEAVIEAILNDGDCDLIMKNENFDLGEREEKIRETKQWVKKVEKGGGIEKNNDKEVELKDIEKEAVEKEAKSLEKEDEGKGAENYGKSLGIIGVHNNGEALCNSKQGDICPVSTVNSKEEGVD
uniref:Uncharacterized protein n=1 Tax=Cannabis sativa TaxID=3483 RepID=A0A803PJV1_CANSA